MKNKIGALASVITIQLSFSVFAFTSGCAGTPAVVQVSDVYNELPVHFSVDYYEFSDEQILDIIDACEEWNTALNFEALVCVPSIVNGEYEHFITSERHAPKKTREKLEKRTLGMFHWYDSASTVPYKPRIYIRRFMGDYSFKTVARHELGHALGLGHLDSGVMQAVLTPRTTRFVSNVAVKEFYRIHGERPE